MPVRRALVLHADHPSSRRRPRACVVCVCVANITLRPPPHRSCVKRLSDSRITVHLYRVTEENGKYRRRRGARVRGRRIFTFLLARNGGSKSDFREENSSRFLVPLRSRLSLDRLSSHIDITDVEKYSSCFQIQCSMVTTIYNTCSRLQYSFSLSTQITITQSGNVVGTAANERQVILLTMRRFQIY